MSQLSRLALVFVTVLALTSAPAEARGGCRRPIATGFGGGFVQQPFLGGRPGGFVGRRFGGPVLVAGNPDPGFGFRGRRNRGRGNGVLLGLGAAVLLGALLDR